MKVQWKPATFGMSATPGWLVFFDGHLVASISANQDGTVGLNWGYETPWVCVHCTWESLAQAKVEFKRWANIYGSGVTPEQANELIHIARQRKR